MEKFIIKYLKNNQHTYIKIINKDSLENIYNLFKDGIIFKCTNELDYIYCGIYHCNIKDYDNMIKYYLMVKGNDIAMHNLGFYYHHIKDYDNMLKYYLMAIGNDIAMHKLGFYYHNIGDYDNMLKYYLMAIDKGYSNSMHNLGVYYETIKDHNNTLKYYHMAIDKGTKVSMHNIYRYYENIKDYDNMFKYLYMCIENTDAYLSMNNMIMKLDDIKYYLKYRRCLSDKNKKRLSDILDMLM